MASKGRDAKAIEKILVTVRRNRTSFFTEMHKRKLNNKTLDAIGRKLIESEASPCVDIDKIVSNPHLFEMVSAKIAETGKSSLSMSPDPDSTKYVFRRVALTLACIALIAAGAIGFSSIFRPGITLKDVSSIQVPDADPDVARSEVPPNPFVGKLSADRAPKAEYKAVNASFKKDVRPQVKNSKRPAAMPNAEFYAVGYTGDPAETSDGGRIIRVEMKKSSLFAMGVNLPLENDADSVKADLFVGSDGVTRAVRIVN
ncbi:hypothetical protein BH10ACI2_BH10ACI2_07340 [soil metagenome]